MLHEALMLEIYRQALNAGALPTARPRSTEPAHSSERCPSHESNSSENGRTDTRAEHQTSSNNTNNNNNNNTNHNFPAMPQNLPAHPPSMEAYLQMVAAAAQQYGFPLGAAAAVAATPAIPLPDLATPFKLPAPQASPTASSNNSEALDFRTNPYGRSESAEPAASEEEDEEFEEDTNDTNNPLDLSVGPRKRAAETSPNEPDSTIGKIQVKKLFKTENLNLSSTTTPTPTPTPTPNAPLLPPVNPYLAAVAAANIFRSGQFPDWNGKSDLVVDPLEKMSDIVKGPRKEKLNRPATTPISVATPTNTNTNNTKTTPTAPSEP